MAQSYAEKDRLPVLVGLVGNAAGQKPSGMSYHGDVCAHRAEVDAPRSGTKKPTAPTQRVLADLNCQRTTGSNARARTSFQLAQQWLRLYSATVSKLLFAPVGELE